MQLDLSLSATHEVRPTIASIPFGQCCIRSKNKRVYMRVRPTSYLLNSTTVSESLSTGKVFIVDVQQGTCFIVEGDEPCTPIALKLVPA